VNRVVYAIDVGSPKKGLAWARVECSAEAAVVTGQKNLERAVSRIEKDLSSEIAVAIGFEAPCFLPVRKSISDLALARTGESLPGNQSRPWSASAGAYVATMGIPIGCWLLRAIREKFAGKQPPPLTLDPENWKKSGGILLWEAFVSGKGHARSSNKSGVNVHIQDAGTAAVAFRNWWDSEPRPPSVVTCKEDEECISTLGAMVLWAGWPGNLELLKERPHVLWPTEPYGKDIVLDS
jgi:hypothetical protein